MNTNKAIAYLIITFLAGIILATTLYSWVYIDNIQKYEMLLEVGEKNSFNIATDKIYFAKVKPGSQSERTIQVTGNPKRETILSFDINGPLKEWVMLSENHVRIMPGEIRNITITATVPQDAEIGVKYTSTLVGTFTRW